MEKLINNEKKTYGSHSINNYEIRGQNELKGKKLYESGCY